MSGVARLPSLLSHPPPHLLKNESSKDWMTPTDVVSVAFTDSSAVHEQIGIISNLESLVQLRDNPEQFLEGFRSMHEAVKKLATDRQEYKKIPLEVAFYNMKLFYYALVLYVFSFLLVAFSWFPVTTFRKVLEKIIPIPIITGNNFVDHRALFFAVSSDPDPQ